MMDQLKAMIQIILTGVGAYVSIILLLRVSGKRAHIKNDSVPLNRVVRV